MLYILIIINFIGAMYASYIRGFIAGDNTSKEHMKHQDKLIAELMKEHVEKYKG